MTLDLRHGVKAVAAIVLSGLAIGCADDDRARRPEAAPQRRQDAVTETAPSPDSFRRLDTLTARRFLGDTTTFARVTAILPLDGHLLVADRQLSPHLVLLDRVSGAVVARGGRHGEGPREFLDGSDLVGNLRTKTRDDAWVFDARTRRMTLVQLVADRDSLEVDPNPVQLKGALPLETSVPLDSTWLANGRFADITLVEFLPDGTVLDTIPGNPPWTRDEISDYTGRRLLNRAFTDIRPDGSKVALAYQFENRISIFSTDGRYLVEARGPVETEASFRVAGGRFHWEDENEMAYWAVDATEDLVFALFCGCTDASRGRPQEVHVFTWSGQLKAVVPLSHEVIAFGVSRDASTLWGAVETPYPFVAEWKLPPLE